jgi:hypothetical protein
MDVSSSLEIIRWMGHEVKSTKMFLSYLLWQLRCAIMEMLTGGCWPDGRPADQITEQAMRLPVQWLAWAGIDVGRYLGQAVIPVNARPQRAITQGQYAAG